MYLVSTALRTTIVLLATLVLCYVDLSTLKNEEIAIIQYDSRPMKDYWLVSALWNKYYCNKHGHVFIYYGSREGCHHNDEKLATPWCKVKAMLSANYDYPEVKFFIYMDSDAVIDAQFVDSSLSTIITTVQKKLSWDPDEKPMMFNQDGPCWWCNLVASVGYKMCLNAGKP
jgi:hypothetical protein